MTRNRVAERWLPLLTALGILVLALVQPVSYADADGALTLVAAQAIVEHGAPYLEVYRDHPTLAYDLEADYRLRERGGHIQFYDLGMPWLAAPAVALSNFLGYDMLLAEHEHALQNLLSALSAAVIFLQLFAIARLLLPPPTSLILALIFVLGSPLISTVATGLWNLDFAAILMLVALREIVLIEAGKRATPRWWLVSLSLLIAFSCRPAAGFMAIGLGAWAVARWPWPRRLVFLAIALTAGLAVLALPDGVLPRYYDPARLKLVTPLGQGLFGVLASPARGLFLFCPFLVIVVAGYLRAGWGFWREPLALLAVTWSLPHLLFVAARGIWWGGHCFGPRLLAELLLPAFATLLSSRSMVWWRRPWARRTFLVAGVAAIAINTGSGLFNPYAQLWNVRPNIDRAVGLRLRWRDPQFLAHERALAARELFWQRYRLKRLWVGDRLYGDEDQGVFVGFDPLEGGGRWTIGPEAQLELEAAGTRAADWYLLTLTVNANGPQTVIPAIGNRQLDPWRLHGLGFQDQRILVPGRALMTPPRTQLRFALPDARPADRDPRLLGMIFRRLSIQPVAPAQHTVNFDKDRWFLRGFSSAEAGWRWSDGNRSTILVPARILPNTTYRLSLKAHSLGRQTIGIQVRTPSSPPHSLGSWHFEGFRAERKHGTIAAGILRPGEPALIELDLPQARRSGSDPRRLAIAVHEISLLPAAAANRVQTSEEAQ